MSVIHFEDFHQGLQLSTTSRLRNGKNWESRQASNEFLVVFQFVYLICVHFKEH